MGIISVLPDPLYLAVAEVVRYAQDAGFVGTALETIVAIAGAETGGTWNAHAIGDRNLTQPGEMSVGLWQVNYRPTRDRTESQRDPSSNLDPGYNAMSAYGISNGGRNFKPWSTFTSGAYKTYLPQVRAALAGDDSFAPGVGGSGSAAGTTTVRPVLLNNPVGSGTPIQLRVGGQLAFGELSAAIVGGTIDLTTAEVSEMQIEFEDPDLLIRDRYNLNIGSLLDNYGLRWQVVEIQMSQGPANPHVKLIAHPQGAMRMRSATPSASRKLSPTEYMRTVATASGLKFLGEPTAVRETIAPAQVTDRNGSVTFQRQEFAWEVGSRLKDELGFLAFEAGGTYYFGSPQFLVDAGRRVQFAYRGFTWGPAAGPALDVLEMPTCRAAKRIYKPAGTVEAGLAGTTTTYLGTVDTLDEVSVSCTVEREPGEGLRPAMRATLAGVGPFNSTGMIVSRVSWDFTDLTSPVEVELSNITVLPSTARTAADDTASSSAAAGAKSALDFVTACLRQVGDTYQFGAETDLTDPDPDAFDCSELVQWAAAQVGVQIADGSAAQKAACKPISIAQAAKTRGALLFLGNPTHHVAVSLGDGKNTVEAKGRKYGVVSGGTEGVIGNRFTSAGLIPGMVYP